MSRIAYVNGRYLPLRDATVNIEDRGYQFGDGIYEVLYVRPAGFVDAALHLQRLERSLREVRIAAPMSRAALLGVCAEVVRRNRLREGLLYMQVTRGVARREHVFPAPGTPPALVVTARRTPPFPTDPAAWAAAAITRPDERWGRCDIKSVNLLANVLAKQAAREAGAIEAILITADGLVSEGGSTTVWIVDAAGVLRTHARSHAILPGCTRAALLELLDGVAFEERAFSAAELADAQEVFLTSATSFVRPITHLDGRPVGNGAVGVVTARLFQRLSTHVLGRPNSMSIGPSETVLTGQWRSQGGRVVADDVCMRILTLTKTYLIEIVRDASGWGALYRDPYDGRYWELTYQQGELQGGGPPQLMCVAADSVRY